MNDYLMAEDSELWDIICDCPFVSITKDETGAETGPKTRKEGKKILVCSIEADDYNRILSCQYAKEIWDALQNAHEGTSQTIDELIGNLKTYELKRKQDLERREPRKEKNLILKADGKSDSSDDES
ncbi:uncharacterized protein LOC132032060 [Lycium ferocissimum]|uniref:uncharacterized protein LOC132032060 n=1 Tax=Lycium ferocissimum TaxID=112874 RepID=UPI002815F31C|nr:uncharacterized protein LOC132032060 [Lycium ferocissimum]